MNPGTSNGPKGSSFDRKGSVRRAREMLQAGRRPEIRISQPIVKAPAPFRTDPASHMTQWPLPNDDTMPLPIDPEGKLFVPKGPPPQRPPRPDAPSPSVYSERSVSDVAPAPSPLRFNRAVPSFSQPLPPQQPSLPRAVYSGKESTPRTSAATDELYRQSAASSLGSIPSIPDFPLPAPPPPANPNNGPRYAQKKPANLAPPSTGKTVLSRRSSVSPIPEELSDSPTVPQESYASSRVIPSSWGSAPAESEILRTYLENDSDEDAASKQSPPDGETGLVRQASLGKKGKPLLRTISRRSATSSPAPTTENSHSVPAAENAAVPSEGERSETPQGIAFSPRDKRESVTTHSTDASHFDLEKAPIVLDPNQRHTGFNEEYNDNDTGALEKEAGLPRAVPTMSETRPGARRPPRLDINAVRDAEARGSLTSLPDLIRRATRLATNLEHGRTASRNDLLNIGGGPRFPPGQYRRSGSLKDILASFPAPIGTPEGGHSSWPVFLRRSTLHHLNSHEEIEPNEKTQPQRKQRRCCGMPMWLFVLLLILLVVIILCAVLIPVFLVAVPKMHASSANVNCAKTTPCQNGGVSVSSGNVCSCVCTNGYTGSQCTISGDGSCVTAEIGAEGSSSSKNATMGSELPRLFEGSQSNFSIPLDSVTIMALFSQNNVSCTTENALVSFRGVSTDNNTNTNSNSKRWSSSSTEDEPPTQTLNARNAIATTNGIVFDNSRPTNIHSHTTATAPTATETAASSTQDATQASSTSTSTSNSSKTTSSSHSTSSAITTEILDFSRVSVLYILEKTGVFDAAMFSEDKIQDYLRDEYPSSQDKFVIDLERSGVAGKYMLNFDGFQIQTPEGTVVGGG